jgi:long-chain acyl-CoA synthetase
MVPAWSLPRAVNFRAALAKGAAAELKSVTVVQEDLAFLQYTGGTTGLSKGAMLIHRNILANLAQAHAWIKPALGDEQHHGGHCAAALPYLCVDGELLHFFQDWCQQPADYQSARYSGFRRGDGQVSIHGAHRRQHPVQRDCCNNDAFCALDFSKLKVTLGGGMAVQKAVAEKWKQVTGKPLIEAYGLTETSPAATINPLDIPEYNGAIGLPISSTEVAIRNDAGADVPLGERGELCVRGPQVMKGYYNRPKRRPR